LTLNSGIDLFNVSGIGYHYGLAPSLDNVFNPLPTPPNVTAGPRTAITAVSFAVDFVIPVAPNLRDALGLLMLQNEQTLATLSVTGAPAATMNSAAVTFSTAPTVTCYPEWFTLPPRAEDMPDLTQLHQILEESVDVSSVGDFTYVWPRGNIYLQMIHLVDGGTAIANAAPSDSFWNRFRVRVNQSDFLYDFDVPLLDTVAAITDGTARLAGRLPLNLMGSAGLQMYDQARDVIDSADYTDLASVITLQTLTTAATVYSIRRQLVPLGGG